MMTDNGTCEILDVFFCYLITFLFRSEPWGLNC